MGGRLKREGIHVYVQLIHTVVHQKLTQHCKAIIYSPKNWGAFPGGPVVKNLPCNAGDGGLIPGRGTEISHAME